MKTINPFFLGILSFTLILSSSCIKKKDPSGNGVTVGDCSASWKVDGKSYEENEMTICLYLDSTLNLSSSGSGGDFQLQINPIHKTGTYIKDINNNDLTVFVKIVLKDGTTILSNNVVVKVTELSKSSAKGTFSGDFYDMMDFTFTPKFKVTDGRFSSKF